MKVFRHIVDWIAHVGIALAAIALLASMALIVYSVVMRYGLNQPIAWVDELVGYLLVACVMLAAADALREGEHIAVDIITERLSARGKRVTAVLGLLAVAASALLLVIEGWDMVAFSRMVGLLSNGYMAVPMWIPQALVPIGAAALLLAALAAVGAAWRGESSPRDHDAMTPPGIE